MRRMSLAIVAMGLLLGADEPKKAETRERAIQAEREKFEGTWRISSLEIGGKAMPEAVFKGAKLVLKGDTHAFTDALGTTHGVYVIDPTATPKTLDVTFSDGPDKGKTMHGIYTLEGDTYTLCIAMGGKPRPTEFASKSGSGHVLEVLKREKP